MTFLPRNQITSWLVSQLASLSLPVGDGEPPTTAHGWQGEPNADGSNFIPWVTLATGTSSISTDALGVSQQDWRAVYFTTIAGVTRSQTESVADKTRSLLVAVKRVPIITSSGSWVAQQIRATSIGAVARLTDVSPPYFVQTDTVEVWLSKENT